MIKDLTSKKVLVLGLGLNQGGLGVTKFFVNQGAIVRVTDLRPREQLEATLNQLSEFKNIEYTLGEHKNEDIDWADIIVRNPAIRNNNSYLIYAKEKNKEIVTDFGIFLDYVDQKNLIAITGTKGKSTTASLIYEALKSSGKQVIFAGNIGKSILDTLNVILGSSATPASKETLIVAEISSFQLQLLEGKKIAPHIAVITNIFPDHLNWHSSMEEYTQAKKAIAVNQTANNYLILKKDDPVTGASEFTEGLNGNIVFFSIADLPKSFNPLLKGNANLENFAAALAVVKLLGIEEDQALEVFKRFKGAEFRQQIIKEVHGIKIINDSAATNPNATIEALKAYPNSILITGGMNKNLSYKELAENIKDKAKYIFFIEGDVTGEVSRLLTPDSRIQGTYSNLVELLEAVKKIAQSEDIILFSPGATSFNLFQNEFDRGRKFNQAVQKVFG